MINIESHIELIALLKKIDAIDHPYAKEIARYGIYKLGKYWQSLGDNNVTDK